MKIYIFLYIGIDYLNNKKKNLKEDYICNINKYMGIFF